MKKRPAPRAARPGARRTAKAAEAPPLDPAFASVVAAFALDRGVTRERGWGAGNHVLKVKGRVFAMLWKGRLVAKLPRERVDALVGQGVGERFDPGHGRVMKEWVVVEPGRASWVDLAREAWPFVEAAAGGATARRRTSTARRPGSRRARRRPA